MALFNCTFFSRYLSYDTQVNVILPENRGAYAFDDSKPYRFQALYLLHGRGDDCNGWMRGTSIERYAKEHRIAVIMPSGADSFYVDSAHGKRYFSYLTKELPKKMKQWFPISDAPEDTFIAGLSMGGYGAAKVGFTYPERFAGIGLFSAALRPDQLYNIFDNDLDNQIMNDNIDRVFGGIDAFRDEDMPICMVEKCLKEGKKIPPIVHYEGRQDIIYDMNVEFSKYAPTKGLDYVYEEWEGIHDWDFWDVCIQKALAALPLKREILFD